MTLDPPGSHPSTIGESRASVLPVELPRSIRSRQGGTGVALSIRSCPPTEPSFESTRISTVTVKLRYQPTAGRAVSTDLWVQPQFKYWQTPMGSQRGRNLAILGTTDVGMGNSKLTVIAEALTVLEADECTVTLEDFNPGSTPPGQSGTGRVLSRQLHSMVEDVQSLLGTAVKSIAELLSMSESQRSMRLSEQEGEALRDTLSRAASQNSVYADAMLKAVFGGLMARRVSSTGRARCQPVSLGAMLATNLNAPNIRRVSWTRA